MATNSETVNALTESIIGAAVKVHRALGPGMLESTYEVCLTHELAQSGHTVERQKDVPVQYGLVKLDCGYRLDMLVDDAVIVEVKALEIVLPIHKAQLLSYVKLSGKKAGLLINFNVTMLVKGVHRVVDGL